MNIGTADRRIGAPLANLSEEAKFSVKRIKGGWLAGTANDAWLTCIHFVDCSCSEMTLAEICLSLQQPLFLLWLPILQVLLSFGEKETPSSLPQQ
jgi:hypothetical protein